MTEVITLISSLRVFPNDILMTVKYKECKLFSPSVLSPYLRLSRCASGFTKRKSAVVVAQINIPAAQETRKSRASLIHAASIFSFLNWSLRNAQMLLEVLSPGLISLPEGMLTCMLMELGNVQVMQSSGWLVITNLNFFKQLDSVQRLSVCRRLLKSSVPGESCWRPPHSSNASITITRSSSCEISFSTNNGSSMSNLKRQSMSNEICPSMPLAKCWQREGY